ncbi:MAG: dihydropteroate synthase [Treponema sp.]|nr:dihydropteroate synthase [Treponema sp.]
MTGKTPSLPLANRTITTQNPAFVMSIVNADHDSFFAKSRGGFGLAKKHIEQGADIIDVGGESTRPGSRYIDAKEEIKRVVPVIKKIRRFSDIPISVDTRKYDVMSAAFDAGADILNDVSAMEDDPRLIKFCAEKKIPVILMHKKGIPAIMQNETNYDDVFKEVSGYLEERAEIALQNGISSDKIIVDPGVGFGKNVEQNAVLIKRAGELCHKKFMVLMALSRKSFFGAVCGRKVGDRLWGTIAADVYSILNGVSMVRVHDTAAAVDSVKVIKEILDAGS